MRASRDEVATLKEELGKMEMKTTHVERDGLDGEKRIERNRELKVGLMVGDRLRVRIANDAKGKRVPAYNAQRKDGKLLYEEHVEYKVIELADWLCLLNTKTNVVEAWGSDNKLLDSLSMPYIDHIFLEFVKRSLYLNAKVVPGDTEEQINLNDRFAVYPEGNEPMTEMRVVQSVFGKHPFDVLSKAKTHVMRFITGDRVITNEEYLILRSIAVFAKREPFEVMHTMNTNNVAPEFNPHDDNEVRIAKEAYHFIALLGSWLGQIHNEREMFEVFLHGYEYELNNTDTSQAMDVLRGIREIAYVV